MKKYININIKIERKKGKVWNILDDNNRRKYDVHLTVKMNFDLTLNKTGNQSLLYWENDRLCSLNI